ncbi:MAG: hypothetical protein L0Y39_06835 [Methylococcaceae bacterium]|nr:hypothetical protein [Methylococcaceae bacterium]
MFVLDTNVASKFRKAKVGKAGTNATKWAISMPPVNPFISVITILELETGVLLVERRDAAQGAILMELAE